MLDFFFSFFFDGKLVIGSKKGVEEEWARSCEDDGFAGLTD